MGGPTHDPRQLALQAGVTESGALRAVRGAVEQATVAVPAALSSSEVASSDVGLIGVLAAVLADEVASRLVLQLERMPPEPEPLPPPAAGGWLTVDEVSRMARLSHRTVYRALRSGALAGEKVGALWRIRPAAVQNWAGRRGRRRRRRRGRRSCRGRVWQAATVDGHVGALPVRRRTAHGSARGPPECGVREAVRMERPQRRLRWRAYPRGRGDRGVVSPTTKGPRPGEASKPLTRGPRSRRPRHAPSASPPRRRAQGTSLTRHRTLAPPCTPTPRAAPRADPFDDDRGGLAPRAAVACARRRASGGTRPCGRGRGNSIGEAHDAEVLTPPGINLIKQLLDARRALLTWEPERPEVPGPWSESMGLSAWTSSSASLTESFWMVAWTW